jgi:hypothetical protein
MIRCLGDEKRIPMIGRITLMEGPKLCASGVAHILDVAL